MKIIGRYEGHGAIRALLLFVKEEPMKILKTTIFTAIKIVAAVVAAIKVLRDKGETE